MKIRKQIFWRIFLSLSLSHNEIYTYDNIDREYKYKNENKSERKILYTRLFRAIRQIAVYSLYPPSVKVYQSSRGRVSRIVPRVKFSRDRADNALLRHLLFPCISLL